MTVLSKRLEKIAMMVSPGKVVADIGTDHGFVPIFLVKKGTVSRAIASDVREGPLKRAREHIEAAGLSDRIECRLGDGLQTLKRGEADRVILSGMGGKLIIRLLSDAHETVSGIPELILSPHTGAPEVRRYLGKAGFRIEDEDLIKEDGKYYTVIRAVNPAFAENETKNPPDLSEQTCDPADDMEFGPVLLRKRPAAFLHWLSDELKKEESVLRKLDQAKPSEESDRIRMEKTERIQKIRALLK